MKDCTRVRAGEGAKRAHSVAISVMKLAASQCRRPNESKTNRAKRATRSRAQAAYEVSARDKTRHMHVVEEGVLAIGFGKDVCPRYIEVNSLPDKVCFDISCRELAVLSFFDSTSHAQVCIEKGNEEIGIIVVASSDRSTDSVDASKGVPRVNIIFTTKGAVAENKRGNGGKTQAKTDRDTCVTVFKRTAGSR